MKKSILLILVLLTVCMAARAQKFALIDMEYILKNIPAYENVNNELEQASRQWQAEVNKLSQETKTLYESYQNAGSKLTDAQRKEREDQIVEKEKSAAELRRKYFGPEGELAKKRNALMRPIEDEVYNAVKRIATRQGYAAVIDRASASSIFFASPSIDISDEVLSWLGYSN